ncbi:MAG: hypothetical protein JSV88_22755, partial [Candidatus Aminicenantes bacterium]
EKGFKKGETVLIIGSAGAGKTLLALNFMLAGLKEPKKDKKVAVWVNLEGDIGTLKFATAGFVGDIEKDFKKLFDSANQSDDKGYFKFFNFPPIYLDLNKIVYTLEAIHRKYTIDRLVIDSITELERAKGGGQPEVKSFLAGLIQFLRDRNITTIFISRSDTFFRSIDKIEEQISSLVDLIICIRNFDMHNRITRGVYIQKARGRTHDSRITRMTIDSHTGIKIEDSGWDVENLLAGDTSSIQGPRVFFKLFYENPAEKEINEAIIKDFDEQRYPGVGPSFSLVRKANIYTEFWSFRGQYSAGHANTRVLSIADHVISAFRDNNRLTELEDYVKNELLQNIQRDKHLIRLYNPQKENSQSEEFIIDAIPCYRDIGVMLYKSLGKKGKSENLNFPEKFASLTAEMSDHEYNDLEWLGKEYEKNVSMKDNECTMGYTWEDLLKWIKDYKKKGKREAFAFPSLERQSESIAFFMELLWSYGGDIYNIPLDEEYTTTGFRDKFKYIIKKSILYDLLECKDYLKGYKSSVEQVDSKKRKKNGNNETASDIIKSLMKNEDRKENLKIYRQIEERFIKYEIGQRQVDFSTLMKWTVDNIVEDRGKGKQEDKKGKEHTVLTCDEIPFKETIKFIMRLIHEARVPNPIHGDFRDQAVLSRHWYSQLHKIHLRDRKLLPLPLAKIRIDKEGKKGYYRSVTCNTYWFLVMLKDALSPEIGGNFIESMNAPEYYEERLKKRAGMPSMNWELEKKEFIEFDPDSYKILIRIMNNEIKFDTLKAAISEEIKKKKEKEEGENEEEVRKNFENIMNKSDHAFVGKKMFEVFLKENEIDDYLQKQSNNLINQRMFYAKYRQTRTAFYQIEKALHYQLRQLLIPDSDKEEVPFLKGIYDEIRYLCLPKNSKAKKELKRKIEKEGKTPPKNWDNVFPRVINELKLHIILELLMYFYHLAEHKGK